MQQIELAAEIRTEKGSAAARRLRRAGKVPAVLYGHEVNGIPLTLDARTIEKVTGPEGFNGLIDLKISGEAEGIKAGEQLLVLIKSHQANPLSRLLTHLDLYKVNLKEEVSITVPLHVEGTAPGVKAGGILDVIRREVDVRCLPTNIPEFITMDISSLEQGQTLHLRDLALPEGVTVPSELNYTVATVVAPKVVQEEDEAAEVVAEAAPEGEATEEAKA